MERPLWSLEPQFPLGILWKEALECTPVTPIPWPRGQSTPGVSSTDNGPAWTCTADVSSISKHAHYQQNNIFYHILADQINYRMHYQSKNSKLGSLFWLTAVCGRPPLIERASFFANSTAEGGVTVYKCSNGTVTEGQTSIVCQNDGTWSHTDLYCRRKTTGQNLCSFFI